MDPLIAAKRWYDTVAVPYKQGEKGEGKQIFVKLFGKGNKQPIAFIKDGTPDDIWDQIQFLVNTQSAAYSGFDIYVCSAANDEKGLKYTLVYYPTGSAHNGNSAGVGNVPGYSAHDIGAIERRLEQKFEDKLKHMQELREKDDIIAGLMAEKSAKRKKGDTFDRIAELVENSGLNLENPQSVAAVGGFLMGALKETLGAVQGIVSSLTGNPQQMPGIAGPREGQGAKVHRSHIQETVPNDFNSQPDLDEMVNTEELEALTDQEELAMQALDILAEAGIENPGQTVLDIAIFFRDNRAMAEGLVNMAKSMKPQQ